MEQKLERMKTEFYFNCPENFNLNPTPKYIPKGIIYESIQLQFLLASIFKKEHFSFGFNKNIACKMTSIN